MILLGFLYSYYVSSYHNWHKKTKFILKLLGYPQIDAFFCDICAHWKTHCYRRTATALNALILCIG